MIRNNVPHRYTYRLSTPGTSSRRRSTISANDPSTASARMARTLPAGNPRACRGGARIGAGSCGVPRLMAISSLGVARFIVSRSRVRPVRETMNHISLRQFPANDLLVVPSKKPAVRQSQLRPGRRGKRLKPGLFHVLVWICLDKQQLAFLAQNDEVAVGEYRWPTRNALFAPEYLAGLPIDAAQLGIALVVSSVRSEEHT